jgi:hypothetical protein
LFEVSRLMFSVKTELEMTSFSCAALRTRGGAVAILLPATLEEVPASGAMLLY